MAQQPMTLEEALAAGGRLRTPSTETPQAPPTPVSSHVPLSPTPSHRDTQPRTLEEALAAGGRLREDLGTGAYPAIAFANKGLAESVTFGLGSNWLEQGLRSLGVTIPERDPENIAEGLGYGTGFGAGILPGSVAGVARLATMRPGGVMEQIGRTILDPFLRRPGTAIATEIAAGAGAGAGREEGGPIGEIVGGLAGGLGVGGYLQLRNQAFDLAQQSVRSARQRFLESTVPFTEAGARPRASAQLQLRSADPRAAAARIRDETIGGLSPAQQAGEDNLLALEQVIRTRNPEVSQAYTEQLARSEQALRDAAEQLSGGSLEPYIERAIARAQSRLEALTPERQMSEASQVYTDELMQSLAAARRTESSLWDIPNIRVRTTNVRERFNALNRDLPAAQADDMPTVARRLLGRRPNAPAEDALLVGPSGEVLLTRETSEQAGFRASESVRELHGFYSQMREEARNARAAGRMNAARIADELANAAWDDLVGAADAPTAVGAQLQAAREYSRSLNETFRQGDVGRLLGYARTGERRVEGPEAFERVLGSRGGASAAITTDELRAAAEFGERDPTRAVEAIQDYIKRRFLMSAGMDASRPGEFSVTGARTFLRRNSELLNSHPELRQQMTRALREMESADAVSRTRRVVSQALTSERPQQAIARARTQVAETTSLRTGLIDYGLRTGRMDDNGNYLISGARLRGLLRNQQTRAAYGEIFSPEELSRLERIADELEAVQRASRGVSSDIPGTERLERPTTGRTGQALTYMMGTIGARVGAWFGGRTSGASLRTASRLSRMSESGMDRFMNQHSDKLLAEAATNPSLYRALMTPLNAPESQAMSAERTLQAWMRRTARALGTDTIGPTTLGLGAVSAGARDK